MTTSSAGFGGSSFCTRLSLSLSRRILKYAKREGILNFQWTNKSYWTEGNCKICDVNVNVVFNIWNFKRLKKVCHDIFLFISL